MLKRNHFSPEASINMTKIANDNINQKQDLILTALLFCMSFTL
jgi:hypothetical protein